MEFQRKQNKYQVLVSHVLLNYSLMLQNVTNPACLKDKPNPKTELTNREIEILSLIAKGLLNKEIALHLCISAATVKRHAFHLFQKIPVRNRAEAVRFWYQECLNTTTLKEVDL